MNKTFIYNLILVIGLNALIKPIYIFGIDRGLQNAVGAPEYGLYFALFNFVYLFQILNDFGIQNFHHSVFSKYQSLIPKYLPRILGVKLALALIFAGVTLLFALLIGFADFLWPLLTLIIINQILASFLMYLRTTLSALGYYRLDSLLSITDKFLMIITVGWLLWFSSDNTVSILQFVVLQSGSFIIALLIASIFLLRVGQIGSLKCSFDVVFALALFKQSIPYALVLFFMTLYTRMDGVMLERMLPDGREQAGIYAASYRILDAFSTVGLLFAGLLLPMFAKLIHNHRPVDNLTQTARNLLVTFSITLISIAYVYADSIILLLYPGANDTWVAIFRVLFLSYLGISLGYIYGTLLTAHESIASMNRILVAGVFINLVLNVIFIPFWKAWGAALATVITQLTISLFLIVLAHRRLDLPANPGGWVQLLLYSTMVFTLTLWSRCWPIPWPISILLVGLTALGGALLFKVINLRLLTRAYSNEG